MATTADQDAAPAAEVWWNAPKALAWIATRDLGIMAEFDAVPDCGDPDTYDLTRDIRHGFVTGIVGDSKVTASFLQNFRQSKYVDIAIEKEQLPALGYAGWMLFNAINGGKIMPVADNASHEPMSKAKFAGVENCLNGKK